MLTIKLCLLALQLVLIAAAIVLQIQSRRYMKEAQHWGREAARLAKERQALEHGADDRDD